MCIVNSILTAHDLHTGMAIKERCWCTSKHSNHRQHRIVSILPRVRLYIHTCTCAYVHVYTYVCICVCVYVCLLYTAEHMYVRTLLHRRVCRNGHSKNCTSNCAPPSPTLLLWTEHGKPSVSLHDVSNEKVCYLLACPCICLYLYIVMLYAQKLPST